MTPIGILTRNTARHPVEAMSPSIMNPPIIGPRIPPRPNTGPKTANALPSSSGGNTSRIKPITCGKTIAPANPWIKRKAMSDSIFGAIAQRRDVIVKLTKPNKNTLRRE